MTKPKSSMIELSSGPRMRPKQIKDEDNESFKVEENSSLWFFVAKEGKYFFFLKLQLFFS